MTPYVRGILEVLADPDWDPNSDCADGGVTSLMVMRHDAQTALAAEPEDVSKIAGWCALCEEPNGCPHGHSDEEWIAANHRLVARRLAALRSKADSSDALADELDACCKATRIPTWELLHKAAAALRSLGTKGREDLTDDMIATELERRYSSRDCVGDKRYSARRSGFVEGAEWAHALFDAHGAGDKP